MNNHSLKLAKERGSISLKIHELVKLSEDLWNDADFEKSLYYHKKQNGILRVSKYEFFSSKESRTKLLNKNKLEISKVQFDYDYPEPKDDKTSVWQINFGREVAFDLMESKIVKEMPLLYAASKCINDDYYSCILPTTFYKDGGYVFPTPVLFENVPQWNFVNGKFSNESILSKSISVTPITRDKKNNIICIKSPLEIKDEYSPGQIGYLCFTLFAGFGGIIKQSAKSKIKEVEFHTQYFSNQLKNLQLIYLAQMCVASIVGFKKIVFHCVEEESFGWAWEKFNQLPNQISYDQLVDYLLQCSYVAS